MALVINIKTTIACNNNFADNYINTDRNFHLEEWLVFPWFVQGIVLLILQSTRNPLFLVFLWCNSFFSIILATF